MRKKLLLIVIIAIVFTGMNRAQTVSSVKSVNDNFEEDEGVVMVGKITGIAQPKNDEREYSFTDNNTDFIRIEIDINLSIPPMNETITVSGIMDFDNMVKEVDVKYWHTGDSSIVDKIGLSTVKWLNENAVDRLPFAVTGQFTGFAKNDWEYNFADETGDMVMLLYQNSFPPDFNEDMLCLGVINKWDDNTVYFVYFKEPYQETPVSINRLQSRELFSIYPNPAGDYFSVKSNQVFTRLQVFDLVGKAVYAYFPDSGNQYSIDNLAPGFYYVSFKNEGKLLQTIPLIKE